MKTAIYPGSFDPVTVGHLDIIKRAAALTNNLIVAVLNNSEKTPLFSTPERLDMLKQATKNIPNVTIMAFEGLLADFATQIEATTIIRGLREADDFKEEIRLARTNKAINNAIETIFLPTNTEYIHVSSKAVKEIAKFGGDISKFVPFGVAIKVLDKYKHQKEYPLERAINKISERYNLNLKNAFFMFENEMIDAKNTIAEYVEFVPHPEYKNFVPKDKKTGEYILN